MEKIHHASASLPVTETPNLVAKADMFQIHAVRSLLATAQRIVDVSAAGEYRLINSVQAKLQFISHHANTSLVVLALVKGIEHTIDLNFSSNYAFTSQSPLFGDPVPDTDWIASIKPLLTCLLTLKSTVSGTFTAKPALRRLMQQHGDILMDCWSHEDSDGIS